MTEKPAFIQGVFTFEGNGLGKPAPFSQPATYGVPQDRRAQMIYFRAGNAAPELVCLVFACNGRTMRYFPVSAKSAMHVALAVVEDLDPALMAGLGMRRGPLTIASDIGLKDCLDMIEELHRLHGERFRPAPLLKRYVWARRLSVF